MEHIRNYVQLSPNIATSGQPTEAQFMEISKAGYVAVVNLAMPAHHDSIANEGEIVTELDMAYFHIPVPFENPTKEHVRLFCKTMEALKDHKIWVHCIMNYRVSAFMFHYLTKIEKIDESMSPIFQTWKPDNKWQQILLLTADEIGL